MTATATPAVACARDGSPRPHLGGLDGLRAVAVAAVLAFHLGMPWARGGWVGVDLFFVLSGFLITGLLLDEHRRSGRIDLPGFWRRRARRLLPALFVPLLAVCLLSLAGAPFGPEHDVGRDVLVVLGYGANWLQALAGSETGVSRPLRHTWSLGVEEQFYLLWPLLLAVLLGRRRWPGTGPGRVLVVAGCGAVASAAAMALLFRHGVNPARLYYGTDTRLQPMLVGATLAALVAARPPGPVRARRGVDAAGWLALAALLAAVPTTSSGDRRLYQGGFLLLGLAGATVVAAVALRPSDGVARLLALSPLRWLGKRSYGVYLWHWVVISIATTSATELDGAPLALLRVAATLALAEASYRWVEMPVRTGRLAAAPLGARLAAAGLPLSVVLLAGGVLLRAS